MWTSHGIVGKWRCQFDSSIPNFLQGCLFLYVGLTFGCDRARCVIHNAVNWYSLILLLFSVVRLDVPGLLIGPESCICNCIHGLAKYFLTRSVDTGLIKMKISCLLFKCHVESLLNFIILRRSTHAVEFKHPETRGARLTFDTKS